MQWKAVCSWVASCVAVVCVPVCAFAFDGAPDPGFGDGGFVYVAPDGLESDEFSPSTAIQLPDGKLLLSGISFKQTETPMQPVTHPMLARLNADGSADAGFGNSSVPGVFLLPDLVPEQRVQYLRSMRRLDNGSMILVGAGYGEHVPRGFVAKVDAAGRLDAKFGAGGVTLMPDLLDLDAAEIDRRGRVVAAGQYFEGALISAAVVRLLPDGRFDESFAEAGIARISWGEGKNLSSEANALVLTPDGGVLLGGQREIADQAGLPQGIDYAVARLDDSGRFDSSFADGGWRVFRDPNDASIGNRILQLALLTDGRIVFAGDRELMDDNHGSGLVLGALTADGGTDASFGDPASPGYLRLRNLPGALVMTPTSLVAQPDGKLLLGAEYITDPQVDPSAEQEMFYVLRVTAGGRLDPSFAEGGALRLDLAQEPNGIGSRLGAMGLQGDGDILLAGRRSRYAPDLGGMEIGDLAVVRLLNESLTADRVFANGFE